jgi:hypothetical protein
MPLLTSGNQSRTVSREIIKTENMNNSRQKATRSWFRRPLGIVSVVVAALLVLGALELFNVTHFFDSNKSTVPGVERLPNVDYSPATTTDNEEINQQKQDGSLEEPTPVPETITLSFSRLTQDLTNTVVVRALVSGATDGTCTLTFTQGSHTLSRTAAVENKGNYYGCAGFDVPVSEFPVGGSWQAKLAVSAENKQGSIEQSIEIKK